MRKRVFGGLTYYLWPRRKKLPRILLKELQKQWKGKLRDLPAYEDDRHFSSTSFGRVAFHVGERLYDQPVDIDIRDTWWIHEWALPFCLPWIGVSLRIADAFLLQYNDLKGSVEDDTTPKAKEELRASVRGKGVKRSKSRVQKTLRLITDAQTDADRIAAEDAKAAEKKVKARVKTQSLKAAERLLKEDERQGIDLIATSRKSWAVEMPCHINALLMRIYKVHSSEVSMGKVKNLFRQKGWMEMDSHDYRDTNILPGGEGIFYIQKDKSNTSSAMYRNPYCREEGLEMISKLLNFVGMIDFDLLPVEKDYTRKKKK